MQHAPFFQLELSSCTGNFAESGHVIEILADPLRTSQIFEMLNDRNHFQSST
jgi:hypothetical protein